MNIANKPKAIQNFALKINTPEWEVHKAIFELNTGEVKTLEEYFITSSFINRLKQSLARVEDIHIHCMQAHIPATEYTPISTRIQHLKQDLKIMIEAFSGAITLTQLKNAIRKERIDETEA